YSSPRPPALPSADRWRVLDSALVPEVVQAAGDRELGAGADVTVEGLAVISDMLDDADHPVLGEAELFAEIAVTAEHALEFRLVGLGHLVCRLLLAKKNKQSQYTPSRSS